MKLSVASVVAFAAAALAKPAFLNSNYDIQEGVPITLRWGGAEGPVTITLMTGTDPNNLKPVATLTSDETGNSFTYTPSDLPSGTYAFRITDSTNEANYSPSFQYEGTGSISTTDTTETETATSGTATTTAETTVTTETSSASTTETETETTETETTETTETSTSETETTETTEATSTPTTLTTTTSEEPTTTTEEPTTTPTATPTDAPENNNSGNRFASPLALVLVTFAALVFFN